MSVQINRQAQININHQSSININHDYSPLALILELTYPPSSDVNYWNSFFNLPSSGNPFTSAEVDGNILRLYGASNITIPAYGQFRSNYDIVSILDDIGCIVTAEEAAFQDCGNLVTVNLPVLLTAGNYCFDSCYNLANISLQNLTIAGEFCFSTCINYLTTLSLPSLTTAGTACFYNCPSLTSISLPLLTTIPYSSYLFLYCYSLSSVSLPSIVSIPDNSIFYLAGYNYNPGISYLDISSCTDLGGSQYDDGIFNNFITGIAPTFTLIANDYLRTNNSGGGSYNWPDADGDIAYLDSSSTLNVTWV
jgi:hypothetical protein